MNLLRFFLSLTLACLLLALISLVLPVVGAPLSDWFVQAGCLSALFCVPAAVHDMAASAHKALGFFGWVPK